MERPPYAPPSFKVPSATEWCFTKVEWFPDQEALNCFFCNSVFSVFKRRHHCRLCGGVYCHSCCNNKVRVATVIEGPQRVCNLCHEHVRGNPLLNDDSNQELKETSNKNKKKENNFQELENNKICSWNLLSDDLIIKIFYFLPLSDYFQLPFVCRKFSKIFTSADILWRNLYCLRWNVNIELTKNLGLVWRKTFKEKFINEKKESGQAVPRWDRLRSSSQSGLQTVQFAHPPHIFSLRLAILGARSVGKTSLVNHWVNNEFKSPTPTVGASFSKKVIQLNKQSWVQFYMWEVAGLEKFHSIAPLYYGDAHAAILVYDMSAPDSLKRCKEWHAELQISRPNIVFILLGTKRDLVSELSLSLDDVHAFIKNYDIRLFEQVSAKTGLNLSQLLEKISLLVLDSKDNVNQSDWVYKSQIC